MRNEAADRFADCVVSRSEHDLILRMSLLLFTAFVMPLVAGAISTYIIETYISDGVLTANSTKVSFCVFITVFCSVICFIMYVMVGRTSNHMKRDREWFDSLADYAESKGCDTSELRGINTRYSESAVSLARITSFVCWLSTVVLMFVTLFYFTTDLSAIHPLACLLLIYVIMVLQFFLAMIPTVSFATNHDRYQSRFTESLKGLLASKGVHIESMYGSARRTHKILWLILTIVTFGLFYAVLVIYSVYALNRHIYSQWAYEERLLDAIIDAEGATGIEVVPRQKKD